MISRSARVVPLCIALLLAAACGGSSDATGTESGSAAASPDGTSGETDPDESTGETDSDETTGETDPDETTGETDPDETTGETDPSTSSVEPSTSSAAPTTVERSAERLIPADGDLAEVIFALGLGDEVVATDLSATYPPEADALPQIGYQRSLTAEPIAAFEPTMVLATDLAGPPEVLDDLERLGIRVELIPTESAPNGPGDKIRAVAEVLGVPDRGEELAGEVDSAIATAAARASSVTEQPRVAVMYIRGEDVQLLLGDGSDIDWVVEAAGAINIADDLGVLDSAPVNTETFVEAAPDVLIVTEDGLASVGGVDGLLAVPGIAETPAGASGRILAYDAQYLLGNGPRTGQLLDQLITDLHGDLP